jgi:hypothetical protein
MYIIDFFKDTYYIYIEYNGRVSRDQFNSDVDYLKLRHLFFNDYKEQFTIGRDRIDELILWFEKDHKNYRVSDEALVEIEKLNDVYKAETRFYRNAEIDYSIFNDGVEPFDFQKEGIEWRLSRQNYADFDDAGLGKSFSNISVFSQRYKQNKIDGIIIVCPGGLQYHWKHEILHFVNVFKEEEIIAVYNENKVKIFDEYNNAKVFIIADHLIADVLLTYRKDWDKIRGKSKKKLRWTSVVDIKEKWCKENLMIVVDESHSIKHTTTIKTKAIFSIKNQFKYRAILTATPFINHIEDSWSQMTFLDKSIIGMSENAFKVYLSKFIGDNFGIYNIKSYNQDHVKEYLDIFQKYSIKRLKEDLSEMKVKKLPPTKISLELSELQNKIYQIVTEQELQILEDEFDEITWRHILNKLPIIIESIDNPLLLRKRQYDNDRLNKLIDMYKIEDDPKFIALKSLIEKYVDNKGEKVVVFGFHPKTLDMLHEKFKKYNPLIIHGSLKVKNKDEYRQKVQDDFNFNDKHKIAFLSSLTSSAGINLHHGGNHIIWQELDFDATHFRQGQDRTHRITSTKDTTNDILYYPETIDAVRVMRAISRADFNDRLNKPISKDELGNLLHGIL